MEILNKVKDNSEFDNHKFVTFINDEDSQLQGFVAIHRKNSAVPSFGATRLWSYASEENALKDALRLSRMMSYKAALAGLPCGGAKAVIMMPENLKDRKKMLKAYSEQLNFLKDQFVTGTDVGLTQEDIEYMSQYSDNIVGLNVNPTIYTAKGLIAALKVCLEHKFGNESIEGRTFAIQGLGKIGESFLSLIYDKAGTIYATDVNSDIAEKVKEKYPNIHLVDPEEIHKQEVDIFSPCALSHSLNVNTINQLKCKVIIGGANNQLESDQIGDLLHKLGILYAPDYVVNAGGLIAVYSEYLKQTSESQLDDKIQNMVDIFKKILKESVKSNTPTHRVANSVAEEIFNDYE